MSVRLATAADIAAILRAQNDTAAAIAQAGVTPWDQAVAEGILANAAHPRGQYRITVSETQLGVQGFMLTKRQRNQPPEPDPTVMRIQLVAARITNTPTIDRARLRLVGIETFREMHQFAFANELTWRARFLKSTDGNSAIESLVANFPNIGLHITTEKWDDGRVWTVIESNDPVLDPSAIAWPAS